jgi:hypothetical protein
MDLFSQTAYALTIPEFTESSGKNLLLYGTDLGLGTHTQCTSTLHGPTWGCRGHLTSIYTGDQPDGAGGRDLVGGRNLGGNLFPLAGLYQVGHLPEAGFRVARPPA